MHARLSAYSPLPPATPLHPPLQLPEEFCSSTNDLGKTITVSCGTWSTWWRQVGGQVAVGGPLGWGWDAVVGVVGDWAERLVDRLGK